MANVSRLLFSFGVITDIQYADRDDAMNFSKTRRRFYRKSLRCLDDAVNYWNANEKTKFLLQLGDVIDGSCRRSSTSPECFQRLCQTFAKYRGQVAHCWGNHELYNFSREQLIASSCYANAVLEGDVCDGREMMFAACAALKDDQLCCYHFSPCEGFRFVVIDCYDISALGRVASHPKSKQATEFLRQMNPNADKNDHRNATLPHHVEYNGSLSPQQIQWLDETLKSSENKFEKVIISGHIPVHPEATGASTCLLWNYEEVLEVIDRHSCVVAYFAGHDHEGARKFQSSTGVHHCTFESVLEAVPASQGGNETAFATIDVYSDKMAIRGNGDIKSGVLTFR